MFAASKCGRPPRLPFNTSSTNHGVMLQNKKEAGLTLGGGLWTTTVCECHIPFKGQTKTLRGAKEDGQHCKPWCMAVSRAMEGHTIHWNVLRQCETPIPTMIPRTKQVDPNPLGRTKNVPCALNPFHKPHATTRTQSLVPKILFEECSKTKIL